MKEKIREVLEGLYNEAWTYGCKGVGHNYPKGIDDEVVENALTAILALMPRCDIDKLWRDGHIDDVAHIVLSSVILPLPAAPQEEATK